MNIKKFIKSFLLCFVIIFNGVGFQALSPHLVNAQSPTPNTITNTIVVQEGYDYATRVLKDAWDMNEFSDISQGLNYEGRYDFVRNYQVNNGIFSGTSSGAATGQFYILWPGYSYEMVMGKVGGRYPIDTSVFKCLYTRMKINPAVDDYWIATWQNMDNTLPKGRISQLVKNDFMAGKWRMYQMNLGGASDSGTPAWTSQKSWPGLYIMPTIRASTTFQIDWVRLTNCAVVNVSLSWTPIANQKRIWAGIGGNQQDVLVRDGLASTDRSFTWDVQGMAPGSYNIGIEDTKGTVTWLSTNVQITAAPIVTFTRPSSTSGIDYATQSGAPWLMTPSDISRTYCASYTFLSSSMVVDTGSPASLAPQCKGGIGEADPEFDLKMPAPLPSAAPYRYLTFKMFINGSQPLVPDGMIGRWIWRSNNNGNDCIQVSSGIPYDVGWHTYTVDLQDPNLGKSKQFLTVSGNCGIDHWQNAVNLSQLRFDPNENYTGTYVPPMSFHQEYSWFKLTQIDQVKAGTRFPIRYVSNKPLTSGQIQFYFTNDLNNPQQHVIKTSVTQSVMPVGGNNIFIPIIVNGGEIINDQSVAWDTSSVAPGQYYICSATSDGVNPLVTSCSDAPLNVVN